MPRQESDKQRPTKRSPLVGWRPLARRLKPQKEQALSPEAAARKERRGRWLWLALQMLPILVLLIALLIVLAPILVRRAAPPDAAAAGETPTPPPPTPDWPMELSPVFTPEVQHWRESILGWSVTYRLRPNLIATLMQIESCGNSAVQSSVGATGLFQVMPFHFAEGEDPFDPDTNALRGLTYFADGLAMAGGDVGRAFAGYNGGHGIIHDLPTNWPQQSQDYQYWGGGVYTDAEAGLSESPTLQAWLESGGAALCALAAAELGLPGG